MEESKAGLYIVAIVGVIAVVAMVVLVTTMTVRVPVSKVSATTANGDATGQMYIASGGSSICMHGDIEVPAGCFQDCFNGGKNCGEVTKPYCWSICYNSCCYAD